MKFIDRVKKNKLLYFLGVLIVGVFIVLIVRFTYAYLAANVNEARGNVTVDSDETDNLKFAVGEPLSIDATPTTLPENGENLVDTTTSTATLLANSTNETAEYSYWVYFTISNNTFIYSDGSTPEIILTVTDPTGSPVTNIDGLTYGTYNGVAGFDVTTANGVFAVASDYAITSSSSTIATEQTWNFTLTYLNQSYDQSANYGNSMTTEISMQKEEDKFTFADAIETWHINTDTPNFANTSCTAGSNVGESAPEDGSCDEETVGLYSTTDDLGTSYYFRGNVENNYVAFAGYFWRIIRINGDGTIRMIYDGTTAHANGEVSTDRQIGVGQYNSINGDNAYVGYMYGTAGANSYSSTHSNINNSTIKTTLDNWYETNIVNKGFSEYVADAIYCNDRSLYSGNGYGTNETYYKGYNRSSKNIPQLTCTQSNDRFSVGESIGRIATNGDLTYPIGLITSDEVIMTGSGDNYANYLYTGQLYWTMTPFFSDAFFADVDFINCPYISSPSSGVIGEHGIRPVISLKSDLEISGTGTINDPYIVI